MISLTSSVFFSVQYSSRYRMKLHCLRQRTFLFSRKKESRKKSRCRKYTDSNFSSSFQLSVLPLCLSSLTHFSTLSVFQPISRIEALLCPLSVPGTSFVPPSAEGALGHWGTKIKATGQNSWGPSSKYALVNDTSWASLQICLWWTYTEALKKSQLVPHTKQI